MSHDDRDYRDVETQEMPAAWQSHRKVLKAAVVASAAVAAAAGARTAAHAPTGRLPLNLLNRVDWMQPGSPSTACDACTSDTKETNFSTKNTFSGSESTFLWRRFLNVPAGTYTVDVTPTSQPKGSTRATYTPFRYQRMSLVRCAM
jgi:hypothetical protein